MFRAVFVRLKGIVLRRRVDAELDEELRYHLERETQRNVDRGMSPDAARDLAARSLGNLTLATEQARDEWRWRWLEELVQDLSYAVRTCRRARVFTLTVVGTIGLGLGLLVTAFTMFDAYVLRPAAVRDPDALYDVSWQSKSGTVRRFTWGQYREFRQRRLLDDAFAYSNIISRMSGRLLFGELVTGNYFEMLGVRRVGTRARAG